MEDRDAVAIGVFAEAFMSVMRGLGEWSLKVVGFVWKLWVSCYIWNHATREVWASGAAWRIGMPVRLTALMFLLLPAWGKRRELEGVGEKWAEVRDLFFRPVVALGLVWAVDWISRWTGL